MDLYNIRDTESNFNFFLLSRDNPGGGNLKSILHFFYEV